MITGLISVIVPVYKSEAFLEACVDSITAQSYANIEIILVNDGSPDGSGKLCDNLAKSDSRIKVIHKENGGVASARGAGMRAARGEFISLVDHDDTLEQDMYECLYERIIETKADICICGYNIISNGRNHVKNVPHEKRLDRTSFWETYIDDNRYYEIFLQPWNRIFRTGLLKSTTDNISNTNGSSAEWVCDIDAISFYNDCIAIAPGGCSVVFYNRPFYNYFASGSPASLGNTMLSELSTLHEHSKKVMLSLLPHRAADIEKTINCRNIADIVMEMHRQIVLKQPVKQKLKWRNVRTLMKGTVYNKTKLSALLLFLLPRFLYRFVYKMYSRK